MSADTFCLYLMMVWCISGILWSLYRIGDLEKQLAEITKAKEQAEKEPRCPSEK